MKNKQTRRKFISTTVSCAVASVATPMTFAGENTKQAGAGAVGLDIQDATNTIPNRVASSDFIIFPWGGMPENPANGVWSGMPENPINEVWGDLADMDAMMRDLYDCGFNTSGFTSIRNLKHARKNRLMGIVSSEINTNTKTTQEQADDTIKKMMEAITDPEDRKAVYAVYLRDEPNASLFPQLNIWSVAVRKQRVLPYINLFPDYASPAQLGSKDYEDHLDQFVKTCQPPYISYDNYSLFEGGRLDENRFFGNMESVRNKSIQAGIPFWNVVLANTHFEYAIPTDATLALQVYSTLAYGGKGIGYFTYYTPQVGNYRLAPIDRFGYRTRTWEMMRNINFQIHTLAPEYNQLKSINVFHTGNVPRNSQGIDSAKLVESVSGDMLLVGEFTDRGGKPYALIVNKNMHSSLSFDVQFKKKGTIMLISQFDRARHHFSGEQKWLAPGCGVLLCNE